MSGLLPSISLEASEIEIWHEICDVLCTCTFPDISETAPNDFEFINMCGKKASVPQCKKDSSGMAEL